MQEEKKYAIPFSDSQRIKCAQKCKIGQIGKGDLISFKWILQTSQVLVAQVSFCFPNILIFTKIIKVTVKNQKLGYPTANNGYIGLLRFDEKMIGKSKTLIFSLRNSFKEALKDVIAKFFSKSKNKVLYNLWLAIKMTKIIF